MLEGADSNAVITKARTDMSPSVALCPPQHGTLTQPPHPPRPTSGGEVTDVCQGDLESDQCGPVSTSEFHFSRDE